jgi:hypothetical protein
MYNIFAANAPLASLCTTRILTDVMTDVVFICQVARIIGIMSKSGLLNTETNIYLYV